MAFEVYNVTMTGSAARATTTHKPISWLRVESEAGNAIVYVGDSDVASDDYGATVDASGGATASVALGPFPHGLMNLNSIYFLGTNTEIIHLLVVTP